MIIKKRENSLNTGRLLYILQKGYSSDMHRRAKVALEGEKNTLESSKTNCENKLWKHSANDCKLEQNSTLCNGVKQNPESTMW